ncbi:MAG: hypothetical protein Q9219_006640 [cf. Caloplaca sp. 3 TL-2023]
MADSGTTYSGLCWGHTKMPTAQNIIDQWPDTATNDIDGVSNDKVPTELQYTSQGFNWGYQIPVHVKRLQWFKLDLCPKTSDLDAGFATDYPDNKAATPRGNQTPELIVEHYLTALRKYFETSFPNLVPLSLAPTPAVDWVITVPAMWSESAVAKTRQCAENAGMGTGAALQIIAEPEAAAVYALHRMAAYDPQIGDTFIVCDAGGGTVDLVTYRIISRKPKLRVVEVVSGQGGKCGSVFLNRRFKEFLYEKLGSHRSWRQDTMEEAMTRFESEVKRRFDGSEEEEFKIPVPAFPDSKAHGVHRARFLLKGSELLKIFDPVVEKILALVRGQIEASKAAGADVKGVLMVGGFGENRYLIRRLREMTVDQGIAVWKAANAWTAVVRGACMIALSQACPKTSLVNVAGRSARNSYGTASAKEYEQSIHREDLRAWSAVNDRYEVNTYDCTAKDFQGDTLTEKRPIRINYHVERLVTSGTLEPVQVTIVKCCAQQIEDLPEFVGDGDVEDLGEITVPIDRIGTKSLKKRLGQDGKSYYIIDFTLRITCHSAEMVYELMRGRTNYGRVALEYS